MNIEEGEKKFDDGLNGKEKGNLIQMMKNIASEKKLKKMKKKKNRNGLYLCVYNMSHQLRHVWDEVS